MKKYIKDMSVEQFIENLKQGEILYGTAGTYEMINGIIVHKDGDNWAICPIIRKDYECYFDRPEPELNITVGEYVWNPNEKSDWLGEESLQAFDIAPADDWTKSLIKVGGK